MDKTKLKKAAPAWHAQVAAEINREAGDLVGLDETVKRRRARIGMMLHWVKEAGKADGSIPFGYFTDWLGTHLSGIPRGTLGEWMTQGKSAFKLLGWQISGIQKFEIPPHRLMLAKDGDLSGINETRREQLIKVVNEMGPFRAVTRYAQVKFIDDEAVPSKGRLKGSDGNPKHKRVLHQQKLREADLAGRKVFLANLGEVLDQAADEGILAEPELRDEFAALYPKAENFWRTLQRVKAATSHKTS